MCKFNTHLNTYQIARLHDGVCTRAQGNGQVPETFKAGNGKYSIFINNIFSTMHFDYL